MTYVLEKITAADREKIMADLESDQEKKLRVIGDKTLTSLGDLNWAVDRESNSYIFLAPTIREQAINPRFFFFYKDTWYELYVKAMFENLVHFESPEPVQGERSEFRLQLKAALFAIGRYSKGSFDLLNSIIAEFKDEA